MKDLNNNQIDFVPKLYNPPNVPQARPIEEFWSILSRKRIKDGKLQMKINCGVASSKRLEK